jgi:hypothetical protein
MLSLQEACSQAFPSQASGNQVPLNDIDYQMSDTVSAADLTEIGRQLFAGDLVRRSYDVHGIGTRLLTDSAAVAAAIDSFLSPFASGNNGTTGAGIEVFLFTTDELDERMAAVPPGASPLYDWGPLKFFHAGTSRFLELDTRARALADVEHRRLVGFIRRDALDSGWLVSHQIFYPLWGQLMKECGLYPFHAAGLTRNNTGLLLAGRSGSGKSTLTLQLVRRGYGCLGDDTVFLRQTGSRVEALAFPEEINVTEETRRLLPELAKVEKFTVDPLRDKASFELESLFPASSVSRTEPELLVFPEISGKDASTLMPVTRTEALALCMRFGFFFVDPSTAGRHFEILSVLVRQAACHRLEAGLDQQELERTVESLVSTAGGNRSLDEGMA